tara:strand:- start:73 stop:489 length:417 start_codon:yes stop_codon:yes gene_type:complete
MPNIKDCKNKYIDETMKEYESKKLKISGKRIVKDRKQAIAIALNIAERKCKYTTNDYKLLKEKVKKFLFDDDRKISDKKVPLTNVIESRILYEYYIKKKDYKNSKIIKDGLLKRIIDAGRKGIKINKNIFIELNNVFN